MKTAWATSSSVEAESAVPVDIAGRATLFPCAVMDVKAKYKKK